MVRGSSCFPPITLFSASCLPAASQLQLLRQSELSSGSPVTQERRHPRGPREKRPPARGLTATSRLAGYQRHPSQTTRGHRHLAAPSPSTHVPWGQSARRGRAPTSSRHCPLGVPLTFPSPVTREPTGQPPHTPREPHASPVLEGGREGRRRLVGEGGRACPVPPRPAPSPRPGRPSP